MSLCECVCVYVHHIHPFITLLDETLHACMCDSMSVHTPLNVSIGKSVCSVVHTCISGCFLGVHVHTVCGSALQGIIVLFLLASGCFWALYCRQFETPSGGRACPAPSRSLELAREGDPWQGRRKMLHRVVKIVT